jgi:FkbH-like protein
LSSVSGNSLADGASGELEADAQTAEGAAGEAALAAVERFIACAAAEPAVGAEMSAWVKAELKAGRHEPLAEAFPRLVMHGLDYTTATSLSRTLGKLRERVPGMLQRTVKIAVLGGFTTHQLVDLLRLQLAAGRVDAEVYEADYGTIRQEILDADSGLYAFRPDVVIVATTWRDLGHRPELSDDRPAVQAKVEAELADWTLLWRTLHERLGCQIVQNNFEAPPWRALGNLDGRHPGGLRRFISLTNHALHDAAPPYVTIHDLEHLAAAWGLWEWGDERFYHHAKLPCPPEHLVDYAHSLASLVLSQLGLGKKCLVLDLDNTLWGGVIGDDGMAGIRIGQGDPESEAYVSFQRYVKALQRRGVILAVCSKNTESIAREPFEKHQEMVLRLDDISCFVANWDDKATNIARIARELNIGTSSLVFVDDNPVERSIIRRLCPDVAVPELPADPAYYVRALDRHRYFEAAAISAEDLQRTHYYRADSARQALESSVEDLDAFLRSLHLVARIGSVTDATLERGVQLINRSNQFNVTTKRYANADLLRMMASPAWVTRTVSLQDRFGDNGLISVLLAEQRGDALAIDTWLMSCRVLKRGVERMLLNQLVAAARQRGVARLLGLYIPTAKNGLVREHYAGLGFAPLPAAPGDAEGTTHWELRIDGDWQPLSHFIEEVVTDD